MLLRIIDPIDRTLVAWIRIDQDGVDYGGGLATAFHYWTTRGIHEWIDLDTDPQPRTTKIHEPEFLPRLASYIRRQSEFICLLEETDA